MWFRVCGILEKYASYGEGIQHLTFLDLPKFLLVYASYGNVKGLPS